jgi:hypothetical protein
MHCKCGAWCCLVRTNIRAFVASVEANIPRPSAKRNDSRSSLGTRSTSSSRSKKRGSSSSSATSGATPAGVRSDLPGAGRSRLRDEDRRDPDAIEAFFAKPNAADEAVAARCDHQRVSLRGRAPRSMSKPHSAASGARPCVSRARMAPWSGRYELRSAGSPAAHLRLGLDRVRRAASIRDI